MPDEKPLLEYAIVGAGFGGLAMADALQRAGESSFVILEKAAQAGGTWRDNHYPGAACDVPSHLYSLSDFPNPGWTRMFPQQPEIQAHLLRSAQPLLDAGRIKTNWRLQQARWLADAACWELKSADGQRLHARHLVAAMGGLHVPRYAALPGLESFQGIQFHSAEWRHDAKLDDKRVVVIGCGASAVQFIPEIARRVAGLKILQRTPPWVLPRPDFAFSAGWQRAFAHLPLLRLALRCAIFLWFEILSSALLSRRSAGWARWIAQRHLHQQIASPALRAQLTPDYSIGCKRVLISSNYYPALTHSNVELVSERAVAIESRGVRLANGRLLEADILIHGTGFAPLDVLRDLSILGRDGRSLAEDWRTRPVAHLGIGVHGYPNLHFLLGPNTALGHNSVLYMIECQVRHLLAQRRTLKRRGLRTVEPTLEAQQRFLAEIDVRFAPSAWAGGCNSWYLDERGQNIALWTGTCLAYRWRTRLDESEYRWG